MEDGARIDLAEPLLDGNKPGDLQPGALDSLNYEIVENDLYRQDWRLTSRFGILHYTICKWILVFLVGFWTGVVSLLINVAVENIAGTRFLATVDLMASNRIAMAFAVYAGSNIVLVLLSALLCIYVAPEAAGSGVPEVEAYLNGVDCSSALSFNTFFVKVVGIVGALSSGLMCGKAGPLVHMAACIAVFFGQPGFTHRLLGFTKLDLLDNDKNRQDLVACGAAAGLAAAFRAPIGGVLFALEEAASWWRSALLWRTFFTTAVVSYVLRIGIHWCRHGHCGSYGKGGLILFDVGDARVNYGLLELVPVAILGVIGGTLGSLYNHLHAHFFLFNTKWQSRKGVFAKLFHAALVAFITSICSFGLPWLAPCRQCPPNNEECPTHGRVGNYKAFNCPPGHYNDLAGLIFNTTEDAIRNLFSLGTPFEYNYITLLIFTASSYMLALMTYGILVPSGLFVPAILCGATYGRLAGMVMVSIFGHDRLDESMYAIIGAASFLGGSMRMTVSLCVVILELTNNLSMLPLVMFVLLISKVVGDCFNNGIFKLHIDIKGFDFLKEAPPPFRSQLTARDAILTPPVTLYREEKIGRILDVLSACSYNAFPVLDREPDGKDRFFGMVLRAHIHVLLEMRSANSPKKIAVKTVRKHPAAQRSLSGNCLEVESLLDLTPVVNQSPYTVLETLSLAKTYSLFRQLALRHLCVLSKNKEGSPVVGVLTRHDFMQSSLWKKHPQLGRLSSFRILE
ncbi:chloride channel protein CLC-c [Selaginella moellendorffii]|uniref:chloride channel protein CLC-c n=1 Tax=Selaginella moellendorffii TaxID=88036 RepID=UPI000D1C57EF|nr:chloride channel protein CLC-c [Selaginella moellendorffii]|eukprot:XP_024543382.1 chloride channel protein CLC-c [Selaginella moellendorffii]